MTKEQVEFLKAEFGSIAFDDAATLEKYSQDETEDLKFLPHIVMKPTLTEEVSAILRYCNEQSIPVTPSGARTGLSGGALPIFGGVVLSFEKMNKILKIDKNNYQIITQPGVITQDLQEAVKEEGLFYPPDPASKGSCFIGGNIAENSGGPKAVKYGVTANYVLNLEIVLANGEIIWTGANVLKNATGYNITQLITGSEGTLAIVTKIVLRLIPYPSSDMLMLIPFYKLKEAAEAVVSIMKKGITPSGLEFMEKEAIKLTLKHFPNIQLDIKEDIEALLLVETDGFDEEQLMLECEQIAEVVAQYKIDQILFADTSTQKRQLWEIRRKVAEAVKLTSVYKEEDAVVPRYELPNLLSGVKKIGVKYGFQSICYGHAGDGNLHINILKGDLSDLVWKEELPKAIREIFELTVKLGGTISGEHGIGLVQKEFLDIAFPPTTINLMKSIKKIFDPNNILNPGKILD